MDEFDLYVSFNVSRFVPCGPSYFGARNDHRPAYEHDGILIATVALGFYIPFLPSVITTRQVLLDAV